MHSDFVSYRLAPAMGSQNAFTALALILLLKVSALCRVSGAWNRVRIHNSRYFMARQTLLKENNPFLSVRTA